MFCSAYLMWMPNELLGALMWSPICSREQSWFEIELRGLRKRILSEKIIEGGYSRSKFGGSAASQGPFDGCMLMSYL